MLLRQIPLYTIYFVHNGRIKIWEGLGILPGGPLYEILETETRCMASIDSDYVLFALKRLKIGIAWQRVGC